MIKKTIFIKTPVRYPGGKSKALDVLIPHVPPLCTEYREPFIGGGSMFLRLIQMNQIKMDDIFENNLNNYWINDLFYPVYCFWQTIYQQPNEMVKYLLNKRNKYTIENDVVKKGTPSKSAENAQPFHKKCRSKIEKYISDKDEFKTACLWYILNKISYSGMSMIGSYAPLAWDQNFTINCIKNLPRISGIMHNIKNLKITNLDYSELLKNNSKDTFIFLDPPYKIAHSLYGKDGNMHREFDHQKFANDVKQCESKWMITYNEDEDIIKWFEGYKQIRWDLMYTMKTAKREGNKGSESTGKSGKKGKELLILNYAK